MGEALSDNPLFKVAWFIVLLLGLLLLGLHTSVLVKASEKEVTFEKVQEKTYDVFIKNIAFDRVVQEGEEQIYPKVIVLEDEVQFLDESGKIVSRKPLLVDKPKEVGKYFGKEAILSEKGNFVAIHEYTGEFGEPEHIVEEEFAVFNAKGEELYKITGPLPGTDESSVFLISDRDGTVIRTRIPYGLIDFYDPSGEVRSISLFGEVGWRTRTARVDLSDNCEYLAVLVSEKPEKIDRVNPFKADLTLLFYDTKGNELWGRKVNENQAGSVTVSGNGEYIIIKAFTLMAKKPKNKYDIHFSSILSAIYDREGNQLTVDYAFISPRDISTFSPDADYVAVGAENLMRLIKIENLSIVYEKELPKDSRIVHVRFSPDGKNLALQTSMPPALTGKRQRPSMMGLPRDREQVFIYSEDGTQVFEGEFQGLRDTFFAGKFLIFGYTNGYEVYRRIIIR